MICRATELDPARDAAAGLRDPEPIRNPARRDSRRKYCIGKNVRPHERDPCRRARRDTVPRGLVHR